MDAPVVVLAGVKAELQAPSSLLALALVKSDADEQAMEPAERWAMASLALLECWPLTSAWPVALRPRRWRVGERVAERGREVFDGLMSSGLVPLSALLGVPAKGDTPSTPGILQTASAWATAGILGQWEVDGARDFCVVRAAALPGSDSAFAAATTSLPPGGIA